MVPLSSHRANWGCAYVARVRVSTVPYRKQRDADPVVRVNIQEELFDRRVSLAGFARRGEIPTDDLFDLNDDVGQRDTVVTHLLCTLFRRWTDMHPNGPASRRLKLMTTVDNKLPA